VDSSGSIYRQTTGFGVDSSGSVQNPFVLPLGSVKGRGPFDWWGNLGFCERKRTFTGGTTLGSVKGRGLFGWLGNLGFCERKRKEDFYLWDNLGFCERKRTF
jgi:hypothetical protein